MSKSKFNTKPSSTTNASKSAAMMFNSMRGLSEYIRTCPDFMVPAVKNRIVDLMIPA